MNINYAKRYQRLAIKRLVDDNTYAPLNLIVLWIYDGGMTLTG